MIILSAKRRGNLVVVESVIHRLFGNDPLRGEVAKRLLTGIEPSLNEMRSLFPSEFHVSRIRSFHSLVGGVREALLSFLNDDVIAQLAGEAGIPEEEVRETCRAMLR